MPQEILASYVPRASVVPAALNLTDCPYAWPFCRQPLYAGAMPLIFNATVLSGMGLTGACEPRVAQCLHCDLPWRRYLSPQCRFPQAYGALQPSARPLPAETSSDWEPMLTLLQHGSNCRQL